LLLPITPQQGEIWASLEHNTELNSDLQRHKNKTKQNKIKGSKRFRNYAEFILRSLTIKSLRERKTKVDT
jgi:hypothetical protein